jgi:hypothetical protein
MYYEFFKASPGHSHQELLSVREVAIENYEEIYCYTKSNPLDPGISHVGFSESAGKRLLLPGLPETYHKGRNAIFPGFQ